MRVLKVYVYLHAMKKIFFVILLLSVAIKCLSQSELGSDGYPRNDPYSSENKQDTAKSDKPTLPHFRKTWKWEHNGVYKRNIPLDTVLDGLHNYNYIFKKNIANTYLANFPSPYESDIFITRDATEEFYPLTNVRAYLFKPTDALSYNMTTPFTQLSFYNGGGRGKAENFLDIWHIQNILPYWNAGFRYNLISSDGRYLNQKAKAYNFSIFSSYERERWAVTFFLNQNNGNFKENGGIVNRNDIRDTSVNAELIAVKLQNVSNHYRNLNFYTEMQYNIGRGKEVVSGKDTIETYPAKAILSATVEDNEHWFKESNINYDFFPNTYLDSNTSYDLLRNKLYHFTTKLVLNEHPRLKYLPGVYAGLDFKYLNYEERTGFDSVPRFGKDVYTGTYLNVGIFNVDSNALLNYDVSGLLCLLGDYTGNFQLQGFIQQYFNKNRNSYIKADLSSELKAVNHFFSRYVGNHNIWENDFKNIKTFNVQAKYVNQKLRHEVGLSLSNTIGYVYFDTAAIPQQSNKNLMVFTAWVKQNFKLGNFYFDQTLYYQKSTDENILSLPALALYSHNYYKNKLFNKALELQIGFDVFYNTYFYADNYMPSIMQFYNQREEKTGNYPKVDVFLNLRIKRADFFLKYEHLNYYLHSGGYFSALDYPINPAMFKFGIRWNFFD